MGRHKRAGYCEKDLIRFRIRERNHLEGFDELLQEKKKGLRRKKQCIADSSDEETPKEVAADSQLQEQKQDDLESSPPPKATMQSDSSVSGKELNKGKLNANTKEDPSISFLLSVCRYSLRLMVVNHVRNFLQIIYLCRATQLPFFLMYSTNFVFNDGDLTQ